MSAFPKFPRPKYRPPVHPDDLRNWKDSKAEAAEFGYRLLSGGEAGAYLRQLVLTYSDADALAGLERAREWFWAEALPAAVKRGKP